MIKRSNILSLDRYPFGLKFTQIYYYSGLIMSVQDNTVTIFQAHLQKTSNRNSLRMMNGKNTLETAQSLAEEELIIITNELSPSHYACEIDQHQISAWKHHSKQSTYKRFSPMKQNPKGFLEGPSRSLILSDSPKIKENQDKRKLKAKLREYQTSYSSNFTNIKMTSAIQAKDRPLLNDNWDNIGEIKVDKMDHKFSNLKRMVRKTLILRPFYSKFSGKMSKDRIKSSRDKSNCSLNDRIIGISKQNSSKQRNSLKKSPISNLSELKFPNISQQARLQTKLNLYLTKNSFSS